MKPTTASPTERHQPPLVDAFPEDIDPAFERFKAAAILVGTAAFEANNWKDVTIILENAFFNPLYTDNRLDFANALGEAVSIGVGIALESALPWSKP